MKTTLTVGDDGILTFPDNVMEELGWKEGDLRGLITKTLVN